MVTNVSRHKSIPTLTSIIKILIIVEVKASLNSHAHLSKIINILAMEDGAMKLKIILKYIQILYVLTDLAPKESALNAHSTARDTYQK